MSQREGSLEDPQADSSISPIPHLEAKIHQTHRLARLLTKYAEQLLQEYVQHQGDPFGLPGFSPPRLPVAGLSAPAPGHAGLTTPERLQLDAGALAALPPLLDVVRRGQAELNPRAPRLLRRLEDAARQARALGAAVEAVLAALGAEPRGPRPEPATTAAASTAIGVFPAKERWPYRKEMKSSKKRGLSVVRDACSPSRMPGAWSNKVTLQGGHTCLTSILGLLALGTRIRRGSS
ncbi:cardiotrophin-1 isoform X2 [Rousettus aegyptiacus]|uniref:cardiotrophin-1 isoform X2 n=1 Tax=Rousettus aegyptiacus TaxID=9407 RepID=UPI00168D75E6|nr:cardiotrophin-1 isoform X2 [Rousettus aegyptiacus]